MTEIAGRATARSPARSDGYRPVAGHLWRLMMGPFGAINPRTDEASRHALAAGMRLDSAHRCLEDVRSSCAAFEISESGSFEQQDAVFAATGEAQLLIIAVHRAIRMINASPGHGDPPPALLRWSEKSLTRMRDAFEHIDDRAAGIVARGGKKGDAAITAFQSNVIGSRRITYGGRSLGIDEQATHLFLVARRRLLRWVL